MRTLTTSHPALSRQTIVAGLIVAATVATAAGTASTSHAAGIDAGIDADVAAWIDSRAVALSSTDPSGDLADLEALGGIVGDASVVGLGESTHGSHEQWQVKHRMVRYLVEELGYRTVGFETDFSSGVLIDRYVVAGEGDARQLVSQLSSPMWAAEEILGLVEWMRGFNDLHPDDPVRFLGTDLLQLRQFSFDEISAHVADVAPERVSDVGAALAPLALRGEPYEQFEWYFGLGEGDKDELVAAGAALVDLVESLPTGDDPVATAYAEQHARAIAGWYENYSHTTDFRAGREHFVADSIAWWQDLTGSEVAYWAANVHTASASQLTYANPGDGEQTGTMAGGHLEQRLGDDYVSIGTWVGHGEISSDFMDPRPHPFGPAPADFLEAALAAATADVYVLPLDGDPPAAVAEWRSAPATTWMVVPSLAGDEDPDTHIMTVPSLDESFDAVVYIDESSASHLLGR